ncbi:hypothetical protein BDZ45DRAFT_650581 [Acephala macrosclerotiorum]|nr:hypothetical protein BDZ45DRAFT_650581 [Acephala macrosclerotiorum]
MSALTATYVPGSVPSGESAPFLVASPTDHSAGIVIVAATGTMLVLLTLMIRIFIRFCFSGPWLADDAVFALATVAGIVQASIVCVSVSHGWGKAIQDIDPSDLAAAEKLVYVADLMYIVTLALAKHSLDLLFIRLTPYEKHILAANCIRYFNYVWAVASLGAISLRCHLGNPWIDITADQCPTMLVRWQVITAFNIISEAALFGMSILLVFKQRMPLSQKSVVISAFGMRLPTIAFCALRIHYFFPAFFTTDPTFDGVYFAVWTQTELTFSIMAATIPCLKPFMSSIGTNWGETPKPEFTDSSPNSSYRLRDLFKRSGSRSMKSAPSNTSTKTEAVTPGSESQDADAVDLPCEPKHGNAMNHRTLRGDSVSHAATIMHGFPLGGDAVSTRSNESQQMIIRKEALYSVDRN